MNKYELALVIKTAESDTNKESVREEIEKAQALIARFGGTVDKIDEWGRRRLAYEIRKLTEGYYCFITFLAEPSVPKEIEQRLRITENILRYLIIKVDY